VIAEQLKMNGMSKQDLLQLLAKEGKTYEEYRSDFEYSIKKERLIARKLSSHIIVTDEEITSYSRNIARSIKIEKNTASANRFPDSPDATESIVVDIRTKAGMVHDKLKSGASFETMAKEYSMHRRGKGGDMGYIQPNTLDPGFVALLNSMKSADQRRDRNRKRFHNFKITETRPIATSLPMM